MKVSVGRIVNYVLPAHMSARNAGEIRPAIVVKVWNEGAEVEEGGNAVQLQVFIDGGNDAPGGENCRWASSVCYSEKEGVEGTWHWPKKV